MAKARFGIERLKDEEIRACAASMQRRCKKVKCIAAWAEVAQWLCLPRPRQRELCPSCSSIYCSPKRLVDALAAKAASGN